MAMPVAGAEKININTATQAELETLPGIGPSKAMAIISYREEHGAFQTIEEIKNVSGIGEVTYNNIKDLISVSGATETQAEETNEQVVINELLPNPSASEDLEWIEIKNIGNNSVDVQGWKIADVSKEYMISNETADSTLIPAGGFFVLAKEKTKISLNNTGGETVSLYNSSGELTSQTSYSETAKDDWAWARNSEGQYGWTTTATEGSENEITLSAEESGGGGSGPVSDSSQSSSSAKESKYSTYRGKILLNEILANPVGVDGAETEWLEINNTSTEAVSMDNWVLKDNEGEYKFVNSRLAGKQKLILNRGMTGLILNNKGGENLILFDMSGKEVDKVSYKKEVGEDESYSWCANLKKWEWVKKPTAGEDNDCPVKNNEPVAYFEINNNLELNDYVLIDAGESSDGDGSIVNYQWNFNKEVRVMGELGKEFYFTVPKFEIKFLIVGEILITLKVTDNLGGIGEEEKKIKINYSEEQKPDYSQLIISEFLPDPEGSDDEEWIEIYNQGEKNINLAGLKLDDEEGGSKIYTLPEKIIKAHEYLLISRDESGLALNNTGDSVRLMDSQDKIIDQVDYKKSYEGLSYGRDQTGKFSWTETLSPGEANELVSVYSEAVEVTLPNYIVGPREAREAIKGEVVGVSGRVIAEPGLLGKNIFYIAEDNSGMQIYSYYKDFPNLALGDKVEVIGEMSDYFGEARIKTKSKDDINILSRGEIIKPTIVRVEDINEDWEGALVQISGEITEIKGSSWWVDDKTEEVKVYIKENTSITNENVGLGDTVTIAGVVSEYKSEYRLLPRFPDDVKVIGQVLGERTEQAANNKQQLIKESSSEIWKYLTIIFGAVSAALALMIIKLKKKEVIKD